MKFEITYGTHTGTLKDAFNRKFPFLRIEFFNKPHEAGEATPELNRVHDNVMLGNITGALKEGFIHISADDTVAALEHNFQEQFGLPVQVFRKQKNVWIETTRTDSLTLGEQNEKGKEASQPEVHSVPGDRYLEDGQY
ncbi:MAG: hypothetical protein JST02_06275 [Bacteroidetes bacterium]|nr:hypothetical protein [Bacteroidota bacterium]